MVTGAECFSAPGIPSGGLIVLASVFPSVGLPTEAIGILIALDVFPDAARTMANVTADLAVATVVARRAAGTGNCGCGLNGHSM
ncbi:MAG: cation:dicarboxylase symporter family transporter [Gemmatimonadaceae bacterium]